MIFNREAAPILTVPEKIEANDCYCLTGNEYLSIPYIDLDGNMESISILNLSSRGLLEFSGKQNEPLLSPFLKINSRTVTFKDKLSWRYCCDWLPSFTVDNGSWTLEGEIVAPPGFKGFYCTLTLKNISQQPITAELGWQGFWKSLNYIVFKKRDLEVKRTFAFDRWTNSLILEASAGLPLAALALATEPESKWDYNEKDGQYSSVCKVNLKTGQQFKAVLYGAVNLEADGAGTTVIDLRRHGAGSLGNIAREWLEDHRIELTESSLNSTLNRNLFFSYFYALGRTLDSEELVPVTSRSHRYYVSAAFWSRDTLLWNFPALMMIDQATARELLLTVYKRHIKNAGDHAHYINGAILYPGFELDQLAAYFIALEHYLRHSGDYAILDENPVKKGLLALIEKAEKAYDPESGLYETFLDPSDDPVSYPFLTYSNALLQRSYYFLSGLQAENRWCHDDDFAVKAAELRQAVFKHCMVKGPYGVMFAWAVDGKGKFLLYDNPPGSLQLLAYYGFCSTEDIAFKNTVTWIRSSNNSYFHQGSNFEEAGSLHSKNPWPLGACNDLLCLNSSAADFFRQAEMDSGYFCETVDPDSGRVSTGAAFASAAGFMAYALFRRLGKKNIDPEQQSPINSKV